MTKYNYLTLESENKDELIEEANKAVKSFEDQGYVMDDVQLDNLIKSIDAIKEHTPNIDIKYVSFIKYHLKEE